MLWCYVQGKLIIHTGAVLYSTLHSALHPAVDSWPDKRAMVQGAILPWQMNGDAMRMHNSSPLFRDTIELEMEK